MLPLLFAACGSDDDASPATEPSSPDTVPPETLPPVADGPTWATGAEDVVIRIGWEGGFVTPEMTFQRLPQVLVTGDGRVFQQGPVMAIYPGPLLPNVQVRSITDDGIAQLLTLAADQGLLADRDYESPDQIADAPDTVVEITVDGRTYVHRAYALGLADGPDGAESDPDRAALADFVAEAQAFVTAPEGEVLGAEVAFEPEQYRIRALLVGDGGEYDVEPSVVEWPADAPVALDDEIDCAVVDAEVLHSLFADANQLTWFAADGLTFQVVPVPVLPGDPGC